mmetsp:Transcript_49856/g.106023  ORF Transcript_49856/g.106023 Transcript_49856/m.106023 type:complete len:479 (-) Transcript_49856:2004-3440(-)
MIRNGSVILLQCSHHCLVICLPNVKRDFAHQPLDLRLFLRQAGGNAPPLPLVKRTHFLRIVGFSKNVISRLEDIMGIPSGISRSADSHGLQHPSTTQLIDNHLRVEAVRHELVVGLEAADVVRDGDINARAELRQLRRELSANGFGRDRASAVTVFCADEFLNPRQQIKLRPPDQVGTARRELVLVLLEPVVRRVLHRTGIVLDAELVINPLGRRGPEPSVRVALGVEVPRELVVVGSRNDALLVQQRQDACVLPVDEVEHVLVVREGDELPQYALSLVLVLLELEDVLVELLLQGLVGVVDADLLEVVHLEGLEAEDVQHADGRAAFNRAIQAFALLMLCGNAPVDLAHYEVERGAVGRLHQGLAGLLALDLVQWAVHDLVSGADGSIGQGVRQIVHRHSEQPRRSFGRMGLVHEARIRHAIGIRLMPGREGDVAAVQDGCDEAKEGLNGFVIEANGDHGIQHLLVHFPIYHAVPPV